VQPTARSLILDLLSTLRRGTMPVRALVEAGALLGLEENNVRVSLARLHASGRVERDARGRYRLGPAVAALRLQLQGWRHLRERMRPWRGDWVAVHQERLGRGSDRRCRERALELLGFRALGVGLSLRPDNLRGGVETLRQELLALAHSDEDEAPRLGRVFVMRALDPESEREARGLWDREALLEEARESLEALRASEARLPARTREEAMVETFLVGGRVLRQLVRHPLLPAEILDPGPLDSLLTAMKRYDEIGRGHWAAFLARHDVPHRALPLDSRFERSTLPLREAAGIAAGARASPAATATATAD
jgi:phenylacetic acid degradation operon negative regulatory protein